MKRPRPYIPLSVRVQVALRQFLQSYPAGMLLSFETIRNQYGVPHTDANCLKSMLEAMFRAPQLDHDPALILRKFNPRTGKYTPDANDPAHLVYREKAAHLEKTTGRKPGAARTITTKGSDIGLKTKFAKLEGKPRRKAKIPGRPFPKQSRGFR